MRIILGILLIVLCSRAEAVTNANLNFTADSGIIHSPNYPSNYDNGLNFVMSIKVEPGNYVFLTFLDFETEDCCDRLYIFDGDGVGGPSIANVSGIQTGRNFSSTSNTMTLLFYSDLIYTYRGFAIKYEQVKVNTQIEASNQCAPNIITSVAGFLTSPNWPGNYPNNVSCSYKLTSTKNKVMITFVSFDTEDCCDKVYIYDGAGIDAPTLAVLSGTPNSSNMTFVSSGSNMFIFFNSDYTNNMMGFSAYYMSVT
ncbi:unnamed protein product [Auanema sp. JU1783]|nr:unnamed protein product [Auanema sp. JU1783]